MDKLEIKSGNKTPKVILDPEELIFQISGASIPENGHSFYNPILKWLDEFISDLPKTSSPLDITIRLEYYNSTSMRYLSEFFKRIALIHQKGMKVLIDWYYDEEDEIMREAGEELAELTGLHFSLLTD